ncbi:MAG: hypothetical protein ACYS47_09290 [Planctomycetota bacterium]
MEDVEKLLESLKVAMEEARASEGEKDQEKAGALFELAADLAGRLAEKASNLLLGETGDSGLGAGGVGEGVVPASGLKIEEEGATAGGKGPSAMRWRSAERDMRGWETGTNNGRPSGTWGTC